MPINDAEKHLISKGWTKGKYGTDVNHTTWSRPNWGNTGLSGEGETSMCYATLRQAMKIQHRLKG